MVGFIAEHDIIVRSCFVGLNGYFAKNVEGVLHIARYRDSFKRARM